MLVRTTDFLDYCHNRLDYWNAQQKELNCLYDKAKVKYEANFFNKLFGWKYEDSFAGDKSWLGQQWDFWVISERIGTFNNLMNMVVYQGSIGNAFIELPNECHTSFYKFYS